MKDSQRKAMFAKKRSILHKEQRKGNYDLEDECHSCSIKHKHKISLHAETNLNKIGRHFIGNTK